MDTQRQGRGPGARLEIGAAILGNAAVVDTAPVKRRLATFLAAHRTYVAMQNKVRTAEIALHDGRAKVARRDKELEAAVEALAMALANDGHPRAKPFAALGGGAPSDVQSLGVREKPHTVHRLAEAAQTSRAAGRKTCDAARAADQAANKLQTALLAVGPLETHLRQRRRQRDTVGQPWDRALAALRRGVRSAADEGAPDLYTALFGVGAPAPRKNGKAAPAPAPQPAPTPASSA